MVNFFRIFQEYSHGNIDGKKTDGYIWSVYRNCQVGQLVLMLYGQHNKKEAVMNNQYMNNMRCWGMKVMVVVGVAGVVGVATTTASADLYKITITSTVEYNQIRDGIWGSVLPGDKVVESFLVDSEVFVNDDTYPTRGYLIIEDSFEISIADIPTDFPVPYPYDQTPYFVIRDNDPAADGFYLSSATDWPWGVFVNEAGKIDEFLTSVFEASYYEGKLNSLNIEDAVGNYYVGGGILSYYNGITDAGIDIVGMVWNNLEISPLGPVLEVTGVCPGNMDFTVKYATVGGKVGYAYGMQAGATNVPGCPGVSVEINNARLAGVATADANGIAVLNGYVPSAGCGKVLVQAVDRGSCTVTNVVIP